MAEFEDLFSQLLSDPETMKKLSSFAQTLAPAMQADDAGALEAPALPTAGSVETLRRLMQSDGDARETALLRALAPYLRPSRREKINKVLQIARLSRLAGTALRSMGGSEGQDV